MKRPRLVAVSLAVLALVSSSAVDVFAQPAPGPAPAPAAPPPVCTNCGVVAAIRTVEEQGEASGVGAVAGGVLGGVIGHQFGSGRGNTVATIAGAAGGAYAGHQVEKSQKKKVTYYVDLRMDNGKARTLFYSAQPTVHQGDRVKVMSDNRLALIAN